jgi:nitrogen-specific signal transduction histidine kinase
MGTGLAVSRSTIDAHNGLFADPNKPRRAIFPITLPIDQD